MFKGFSQDTNKKRKRNSFLINIYILNLILSTLKLNYFLKNLHIFLTILFFISCAKESTSDNSSVYIPPTSNNSNTNTGNNSNTTSYTLTISSNEGGSVSNQGGTYNEGESVTITATPDQGYRFTGWSDGSTENSITISINSNTSITANFEKISVYDLSVSSSTGGSVSEDGGQYEEGAQVTLTAVANDGYDFTGWSNGETSSTITITINQDLSITANFTPNSSSNISFINNQIDKMLNCISDLESGYLGDLIYNLVNNIESNDGEYHDYLLEQMEYLNIYQSLEELDLTELPFNFYDNTYYHAWNGNSWINNGSNGKIEFAFPLFSYSSFIDTYIGLSNLKQEFIEGLGDNGSYFPVEFDLKILNQKTSASDAVEVFRISLDKFDYSIVDGIPIPDDIQINIKTEPFYHKLKILKYSPTEFEISFNMDDNLSCFLETSISLKLSSSDYENMPPLDEIEDTYDSLEIMITMNQLKFIVSVDAESIRNIGSLDDLSDNELNSLVDIEIYRSDNKIGELKYYSENETVTTVFENGEEYDYSEYQVLGQDLQTLSDRIEVIGSRFVKDLFNSDED